MIEITDENLLEQLKKGDVQCLGKLYERYKSVLFNYFLRTTGDNDSSNDLVMETFERVYKYRNSYMYPKKVRTWIFSIASNLLRDYFKKAKKLKALNLSDVEIITNYPQYSMDEAYKNNLLQKALNHLKPSQRNIITMYYLLEMSYEDIAACQNISINNARITVCRALKKMKEILKDSDL